jgi:hypothetical protein
MFFFSLIWAGTVCQDNLAAGSTLKLGRIGLFISYGLLLFIFMSEIITMFCSFFWKMFIIIIVNYKLNLAPNV